jgi:hypothetical protein
MKKTLLFLVIFISGLFSANAADIIVLKDGSMIDAKITEISSSEIKYRRSDHLDGPVYVVSAANVFSIRYENGRTEVINASPAAGQASGQTGSQQPGAQTLLQTTLQTSLLNTLNTMPAIRIAGNNLKFQFTSDNWTAMLNGESFSTGTIEVEETNDGTILNLKQTHIWPGAVAGKAVGKLASKVPGGAVAGSALNAAGGLAGAVEASGPVIVLGYKAGAGLSYLRSTTAAPAGSPDSEYIVLADGQWRPTVYTENASVRKNVTVQFSIADEEIGGQVREVLTMDTNLASGSGWRCIVLRLTNETTVQTLQKGSGVRFKVLGDGKSWRFQVGTDEAMSDHCYHEIRVKTKKGNIVEIDVPYSKLKQPAWGKKVPFINTSINSIYFQRHSDIGGAGSSTIKVFDFEIY